MTDSGIPTTPAPGNAAAPVELKDKYGVPYRILSTAANGVVTLQRLVPPMLNQLFPLFPTPDYGSSHRTALEDRYEITRSDDTPLQEIILPVSSVGAPMEGVLVSAPIAQMIPGAAWEPDLLSSSAPWTALSRLADALHELHLQQIFPVNITRNMLFATADDAELRLILADANQLEPAMRQDPWLTSALPPELQGADTDVGAAQNAYMFGALVLTILQRWAPSKETLLMPHDELIEKLPDIYPLAEELKEALTQAFFPMAGMRPDVSAWRDLLQRCATEMDARLAHPESEEDEDDLPDEKQPTVPEAAPQPPTAVTPAPQPAAPAPSPAPQSAPSPTGTEFVTLAGRRWRVEASGAPIARAVCEGSVFRLPEDKWTAWHPSFNTLKPSMTRQLRHLRFPDDYGIQGGSSLLLYSDRLPVNTTGWQDLFPATDATGFDGKRLTDGLGVLLRLLEEIELAAQNNLHLTAPDPRQFLSGGERRFLICGQNVAGAPDPQMATKMMKILFAGLEQAPWLSLEIRKALREQPGPSLEQWQKLLRYAITTAASCVNCGRLHLLNAACPSCQTLAAALQVKRKQGVTDEQIDVTVSETDPIRLSDLYPGAADTDELLITFDAAADCFRITNVSQHTWRHRVGAGPTLELSPGSSLEMAPGLRIALLPGQLELHYAWPQ